MAYNFNVNNTASSGEIGTATIFALKNSLVTSGWTVNSSGDGLSSYDSLGGTAVAGVGSGANGLGNANAWFRVQMPTMNSVNRELIFHRGNDSQWRIKYSYSAGFTGGSPSALRPPSATDERFVTGWSSDSSPQFSIDAQLIGSTELMPTSGSHRYHVATGGLSEKYGFWLAVIPAGGGNPISGLVFEPMIANTYPSEDIDPYIFHVNNNNAGLGSFGVIPFSEYGISGIYTGGSSATSAGCKGWLAKGLGSQGWVKIPGCVYLDDLVSTTSFKEKLGVNQYTTKDDLLPIVYARKTGTSVNGSSTFVLIPYGYKGVGAQMFWMGSTTRTTGDTLSVSSTRDRIVLGNVSLPWDGSVPTV